MKASEIDIPEPCDEDWDRMTPAERGRFCSRCQKKVHDLSSMPESDAQALLDSDDDICISYLASAGGDVRFQPERLVPLHRLARRAQVATAAGLSLALAACAPHGDGPKIDETAESQRPALLEYEPAIPDAEPCESEPAPEATPENVDPGHKVPRPDHRVRGAKRPTPPRTPPPELAPKQKVPRPEQRLGGARRRTPAPPAESL